MSGTFSHFPGGRYDLSGLTLLENQIPILGSPGLMHRERPPGEGHLCSIK